MEFQSIPMEIVVCWCSCSILKVDDDVMMMIDSYTDIYMSDVPSHVTMMLAFPVLWLKKSKKKQFVNS